MQYNCSFCDILISDPKGAGIVRLVQCWLPVGKTSGALRIEDKFMYAHRVCCEMGKMEARQDSLF